MVVIIKKLTASSNAELVDLDDDPSSCSQKSGWPSNLASNEASNHVVGSQPAGESPTAEPDSSATGGVSDTSPGIIIPFDNDDDADGASTADLGLELTEDSAASEFRRIHGRSFRYDHDTDRWHRWSGSRWIVVKTEVAFHKCRLLIRRKRRGSSRMSTKKSATGVEAMAKCDPKIAVTSERWDRNPMLLGTPKGTVDLKTGELKKANPDDFITKCTSVGPAPAGTACPHFQTFLHQATNGDVGVQRLLQQFFGYCLTGSTDEHILLFVYGPGGNGKSVAQKVIVDILGDYAVTAAMETFAASKYERHPTELAMLHGARFVGVSETEKGQRWREALINQLTGGDLITARFMRQDNFTFRPQFKLFVIGNHMPQLNAVNDAAKRRFRIVEFVYKPEKPDPKLPEKLRAEYPAILRWMIDGCLDWQKNGLVVPDAVAHATEEYFNDQDVFSRWLAERCDIDPAFKAGSTTLFTSWKEFCLTNSEPPGSSKSFGQTLVERGFPRTKSGGSVYIGLTLKKNVLNMGQ